MVFPLQEQQCRLPLGLYPDISLAGARQKADAARAVVLAGGDPAGDKARARERAAAGSVEVVTAADTFKIVWQRFDEDHIATTLRPGTATSWRSIYKRHLAPRFDATPVNEITPADIAGMLHALRATPSAADTARVVVRVFFKWCCTGSNRILFVNPAADVEKVKRKKEDGDEDDRTLTDEEIRWFWTATQDAGNVFNGFTRLLLLTGARRNEVARMVEPELDVKASLWKLPAARAKNGRAHAMHLSAQALAVLETVPRIDDSEFVFTTRGTSPISGYSKFKTALDKAMAKAAETERGEPVKIQPWRLHSLRKTFATNLAKLGITETVCERCLNHSSGKQTGLAKIYNRHEYLKEQAAAFDAWGRYVDFIVTGADSDVVPFQVEAVSLIPA